MVHDIGNHLIQGTCPLSGLKTIKVSYFSFSKFPTAKTMNEVHDISDSKFEVTCLRCTSPVV